jgi:hypothetical protein
VRLEGFDKFKYPPHPGLELATFQFVVQFLNQLRYRVPLVIKFVLNFELGLKFETLQRRGVF